jgi:hypothetical protein
MVWEVAMGQVTIYLEDEIEVKMRAAARSMNVSKSKWVAGLIKEKVAKEWPESIRKLAGSWEDFPTSEEIRQSAGADAAREKL